MKYEDLLSTEVGGGNAGKGKIQIALRGLNPGEVYGPRRAWSLIKSIQSLGLDRREYRVVSRDGKAYVVRLKPEDIK